MQNIECYFENGLIGSIDWLSFTIFPDFINEANVFSEFGFDKENFTLLPYAHYGYKYEYKLNGYDLRILFGQVNENCPAMGVHFSISGSSIGAFLQAFKLLYDLEAYSDLACIRFLFSRILEKGQITRLDCAIDDIGCNFFSFDDILFRVENRLFSTKFKSFRFEYESVFNAPTGKTLYFGKRTSQVFLRIYDKKLEQEKKENGFNDGFCSDWLRWELELKDERATLFAQKLVNGESFGFLVFGVLNNYIRFIVRDNENISRCSSDQIWLRFIENVGAVKLSVPIRDKTLKEKREWFSKQCASTLTAIVFADGGSIDFILDCVKYGEVKMSKSLRDLVRVELQKFDDSACFGSSPFVGGNV